MTPTKIIPIILSGGSGKRLWPLSRSQHPKQYLPLNSDNTMLQETILRLKGVEGLGDPCIVCNKEHRFSVQEQCEEVGIYNPTIILEPEGRNTAPAITVSALYTLEYLGDSTLLVLSADHVIQDIESFHKVILLAIRQAEMGKLVTFGVTPISAHTGYGYIQLAECIQDGVYKSKAFVEKPNLKDAQTYIDSKEYLWNSGMFVFQASVLVNEMEFYNKPLVRLSRVAVNKAEKDLKFVHLRKEDFAAIPSDSIDYSLMEKSDNIAVVELNAKWSDVGSWESLYDIGEKDKNGNVIRGDVFSSNTTNTYIHADKHMVAAIGVDNLVIVDTADATLVTSKDKAQDVSLFVEFLRSSGRKENSTHQKVYRPWGWYESIELSEFFQVKKLHITPEGKLSLQLHRRRSEHWVMVSGEAVVTKDKQTFLLKQGDSVEIPINTVHRIENISNDPIEIIEVQIGTYFGEDDIVRFNDIYGRTAEF